MSFNATVIADSISRDGFRLTTIEATYPRIVHSEMMTHRVFARNSASTRAIPLMTQLNNILTNPFIPEKFGVNQQGMQASRHLEGRQHERAVEIWLQGRDRAVTTAIELVLGRDVFRSVIPYEGYATANELLEHFDELKRLFPKSTDDFDPNQTELLNVHKQLAGRGLEAYMWHTVVLTATEFDNFFALRDHPAAQGEIATIARLIHAAMDTSTPRLLRDDDWHLPYVDEGEFEEPFDAIRASVARTAATSYNRQHVKNPDKEFERYELLLAGGHMSPFEHQATPFSQDEWFLRRALQYDIETARSTADLVISPLAYHQLYVQQLFSGNLRGWTSHRKQIEHEDNFGKLRTA